MESPGPERITSEGISMPIYGVGPKRRRKKANPLVGLVLFLLLAAGAWWVAVSVFSVNALALGEDALRFGEGLIGAARRALGV